MSPFDYKTVNLNAIAGKAKACECEDCRKLEIMNRMLLDKIEKGEVTHILVNGKRIELVIR